MGITSMEETVNSRRIARNATMLALRTVISTLVGLYTSRVVLATLGVEDYGIYGVVGSIVAMMGFLNASMSGATSRFMLFEIGRGGHMLSRVFSSALIIHIIIAIVVLVVAETVGMWFLSNSLNIPLNRMDAAFVVFRFSILSALVGIIRTPYSAAIIAHERMDIYAYMELLSVALKLLIVYLLVICHSDKLIIYALLVFIVNAFISLLYRFYCIRHFSECRFRLLLDKGLIRSMLSFSGWDLYGNMCVTASFQGLTMLINIFFGVVYNAAASIAMTVNGAILGLTTTVSQSFRPQIIKQYAADRIASMEHVLRNSVCFTFIAMSVFAVPCFLEARYVLHLWLGQVPEHSVVLLRYIICASFIGSNLSAFNAVVHGTGNIRLLSFLNGTLFLLCPFAVWFAFRQGAPVQVAYLLSACFNFFLICSACLIIRRLLPGMCFYHLLLSSAKTLAAILLSAVPAFLVYSSMGESFIRLSLCCFTYTCSIGFGTWMFVLDMHDRAVAAGFINSKIRNITVLISRK